MLKQIIKRDGTTETFDATKINHWAKWATGELTDRIDWANVVMQTVRGLPDVLTSHELQLRLITKCLEHRSWPYALMAGKLYSTIYTKELYGSTHPTVRELVQKLTSLGIMSELSYTDTDYVAIEGMIQHARDFQMAHFQLAHIRAKYALRNQVTGREYETPQFVYMRMALALSEHEPASERLEHVRQYYNHFSLGHINPPTPNYANLGTPHNGYASCCQYVVDDDARSLAVGDHIAYTMTFMSAGIGNHLNTRTLGDSVRNGSIMHQGKLPYFRSLAGAVGANKQGSRGGACTTYYTAYDPEVKTITMLQNPMSPVARRNRDIHFSMMFNRLLATKAARNEDIFVFTSRSAPDLYEAIFQGDADLFESIYERYESDPTFEKTYISARDIIVMGNTQTHEVATQYSSQIDEMNRHTSFKEPIRSSNLCVSGDTRILTREGYATMAVECGHELDVWNGHEWSRVLVSQTSTDAELLTVVTNEGLELKCTPYHKFYLALNANGINPEITAGSLRSGDRLMEFYDPMSSMMVQLSIKYVIDDGERGATYCVNEPLRHTVVFNGILTGQCNELSQPSKAYQNILDLYNPGPLELQDGEMHPEVTLCSIAGIPVCNIDDDATYASAAYYALKMIDYCIHHADYALPNVGYTAKQRLNAGVGMLGLAYALARKGLDYSSPEGLDEIHRISERHAFHMISASLRLGQELGVAPWIHKTKWVDGWLPIDTYKPSVDQITTVGLQYDWAALREDMIASGGIRNSGLIMHMPTESSSKAIGVPNGVYPVRDLYLKKSDGSNVIEWYAPDSDILRYQIAWDISFLEMARVYAVIQKFTDQSISADFYRDRTVDTQLTTDELLQETFIMVKYGIKSRYYQNTLTVAVDDLNDTVQSRAECEGACML
jgi:ribonucleotide reductase alpha subunit